MSFIKQLLNPFIEFDEDKKTEIAAQHKTASPPGSPVSQAAPAQDENAHHPLVSDNKSNAIIANQTPAYSPAGMLDGPLPEHELYFEKLIDDANAKNPLFAGADYKEFVDSKMDIDDIADEALKFKTAFNILKSSGLTKQKLVSTAQGYVDLIGRDLNAFLGAHAQQYKKELQAKEMAIQKKAEELQALTQRINALKAELNQLTHDINLTKDALNTKKNSFLLAGENKQKEIQYELQKIDQYF